MTSDNALNRLRELLADAGVDVDRPKRGDVQRTWECMRRFAEEPVEDAQPRDEDGDGILAQYGVYGWDGPPHFELDMTRQLSFSDEDGEYSHMTQLQRTFQFDVTDALRAVGADELWSFGVPLDAFFERALALPGFRQVRESGADPVRLEIDYDDV